ncbi:hypothetical protein BT69DRAFT_1284312, partial [Atractiella rhizophila]
MKRMCGSWWDAFRQNHKQESAGNVREKQNKATHYICARRRTRKGENASCEYSGLRSQNHIQEQNSFNLFANGGSRR